MPRSGSTLLQRLVSAHKSIHTTSEPSLLVPLVYMRRRDGVHAEYRHSQLCRGIEDFVGNFPNKGADFDRHLREMVMAMYRDLSPEGTQYFLDKTPSYALICQDIIRIFPDAKFIFLFRNPLSVIASSLQTWWGNQWKLFTQKHFFYQGMTNILQALEGIQDRALVVRYEDLVVEVDATLEAIFDYCGLPHCPEASSNFNKVKLTGRLQDNVGIKAYQHVTDRTLEKWKACFRNPIRRLWLHQYIDWLGEENLERMGYQAAELHESLRAVDGTFDRLFSDVGWMIAGGAYCLLDIPVVRAKIRSLGDWRQVYSHT